MDVLFLGLREFGLLAAEFSLGLGELHVFAGAGAGTEIRSDSDLATMAKTLKRRFAGGVGGVVDGAAEAELDVALGGVLDDIACVGQGTGEAFEFGDYQCVAGTVCGKGLLKSRAFAVSSGETVVDVGQVVRDADRLEAGLLRDEVVCALCGDAGMLDQTRRHVSSVVFVSANRDSLSGRLCANLGSLNF